MYQKCRSEVVFLGRKVLSAIGHVNTYPRVGTWKSFLRGLSLEGSQLRLLIVLEELSPSRLSRSISTQTPDETYKKKKEKFKFKKNGFKNSGVV